MARHSALVRVTHWITVFSFFALLVTGVEIVISHPRFYWGESGNVNMPALFELPIPSSRATVPTSYGYVLKDQNGWSRSLHFQSAWVAVLTGLVYVLWGGFTRHFRRNLVPQRQGLWQAIVDHLRFKRPDAGSYNVLQRMAYLMVIFVLFPLIIWTGLAMSPSFSGAVPFAGRQSARTVHFISTILLVLFLVTHVGMIFLAGFKGRMRAMIKGAA